MAMGRKKIESLIYIATSGANYWCGLSEQGAICTTQSQDDFDGYVATSLKYDIDRFSQFRISGNRLFAYDTQTSSFIFVDSTISINGKGGIKLVSSGDKLLEHYAVSYMDSMPNIKSEKVLPENKIEEFLTSIQETPWLKSQDIILNDFSEDFYSALYLLDILINALLDNKKVVILVDENNYESCKTLVQNCLYLLPVNCANSISFTTNADASFFSNKSIFSDINITKCVEIPREFTGQKISFNKIINHEKYIPKNNYCELVMSIGRNDTVAIFKDCKNIPDIVKCAQERIKDIQKEQLSLTCKKINQSIYAEDSGQFIEHLTFCEKIFLQYKKQINVDELISIIANIGQEWGTTVDEGRADKLCKLIFEVVPSDKIFDYFCQLENASDVFINDVVVNGVIKIIGGSELKTFHEWSLRLAKLKKTDTDYFQKVQTKCAIVFDKFYKNNENSAFRCANMDEFYDEIFKLGQAFNYSDREYSALKVNVETYRQNEKIQNDYMAQFGDDDNKDIKLCKSEKRREIGRNFRLGFNVLNFFSIIIPSVITAIGIFLILTRWIPLEQILISLGHYPLNIYHIALVVSAVVGILSFFVGIVMYVVLSRAKQNLPMKVIGLRVLFVEVMILIINLVFWGLLAIFCFVL